MKFHTVLYQISFQSTYFGGYHFCGGSVYNENFIITAAHCCDGESPEDVQVLAGAHNLEDFEGTEQTVDVAAINMHPDYNGFTVENDICVLELATPLKLNR